MPAPRKIQFAAQCQPVDELSLHGSADASFWAPRLAPLGLKPLLIEGAAQVTLMAAEMTFAGVRFRELSVAVDVEKTEADGDDGMLLLEAFNTVRFFAWVERTWFHTPYRFARLDFSPAKSFRLYAGERTTLRAELGPRTLPPGEDMQRVGPVLLPPRSAAAGVPLKWFLAKLNGVTVRAPFLPTDTLQMEAAGEAGVVADLVASHFSPREWTVLSAGYHGKSKTYAGPAPGFET